MRTRHNNGTGGTMTARGSRATAAQQHRRRQRQCRWHWNVSHPPLLRPGQRGTWQVRLKRRFWRRRRHHAVSPAVVETTTTMTQGGRSRTSCMPTWMRCPTTVGGQRGKRTISTMAVTTNKLMGVSGSTSGRDWGQGMAEIAAGRRHQRQ
jgi:hypothetical protein